MDKTKANALFKAAKSGNVAKIRELLAAGAPIEATDMHRMTPVMVAAQAGQVEAFRTLAETGANLHAVGMDQTDLLEYAAEKGNVEIVRFLIEKGLPLEGHWRPRSQEERRGGHFTPLLSAAINGRAEVVRVLLEAGADRQAKFDGQTALQMAKGEIKHPNNPDDAELKTQYAKIVALMTDSSVRRESPDESAAREVGRFAENARRPAHSQLRQRLDERCGPHRPWKPVPDHGLPATGVVRFTLADCKRQETLEDLQREARKAGCHLVLAEPWAPGEDAVLILFPTEDQFAVVAAVGTEGANYTIQTADVIEWLKSLDEENPFNLVFCGHDLVGGAFRGPVKGAKKLAERIVEFCPSCLEEGLETSEELARALKQRKSFLLWWD